ncbi:MAG: complex I subunit 5 family protein [Bacteroidota bacterium]
MNATRWEISVGSWSSAWRLDGPSLLFLVPILLVAAAAAVFAPAYLRQLRYHGQSRVRFWTMYALFVAGMIATVLAADFVSFLVAWEAMTLASYVLVAYDTRNPEVLRASYKYFVMTHVGTGGLLLGAILLRAAGGSFGFDHLVPTLRALDASNPALLHAVLALLFLGFATKAGLYPFGDWLPDAYPAAPAPVTAVLSGVMSKLGLYGLLRIFVLALATAAPAAAQAWGWAIGGFGLLSALVGGAAACAALDAKVLLAYSSIAQAGLIALGFGAGLVLAPAHPALAALALLGAVFHVVGDAVVKSLLFLNAGAVQWRTGSSRLADLGGLFEAMPVTGRCALVGALAIAGAPPFAAFTAKWLMLQATVLSQTPLVSLAGIGLLIASLLSVLYAVKLFAAAFTNGPMRTGNLEVPASMWIPQAVLAVAIGVLAVAPGATLAALANALREAPALATADPRVFGASLLPATGAFAPILVFAVAAWAALLGRIAVGSGAVAPRGVWTGGVLVPRDAATIDPRGFYSPVREGLQRAYAAPRWRAIPRPAWLVPAVDVDRWLYRPAIESGRRIVSGLRRVHTGVPHLYLVWQLAGATALAVLLLTLLRRGGTP